MLIISVWRKKERKNIFAFILILKKIEGKLFLCCYLNLISICKKSLLSNLGLREGSRRGRGLGFAFWVGRAAGVRQLDPPATYINMHTHMHKAIRHSSSSSTVADLIWDEAPFIRLVSHRLRRQLWDQQRLRDNGDYECQTGLRPQILRSKLTSMGWPVSSDSCDVILKEFLMFLFFFLRIKHRQKIRRHISYLKLTPSSFVEKKSGHVGFLFSLNKRKSNLAPVFTILRSESVTLISKNNTSLISSQV